MALTKLSNLINPEKLGAFIDAKLTDLIKLAPLARIGRDLQGQPGNTLTIPVYQYIGDAEDLAEGAEDVPVVLQAESRQVTVKKAARSVSLSDESILSGYGDPVNEIASQLLKSIANKVDNDCFAALRGISGNMVHEHTGDVNIDVIADAVLKFGEDIDDTMYVFINPAHYAAIRKSQDFIYIKDGETKVNGHVGMIYGVNVVISDKVAKTEMFVIKEGAIGIELKRDTNVETGRDIKTRTNIYAADKHYVAYLRDASKAIRVNITTAVKAAKSSK